MIERVIIFIVCLAAAKAGTVGTFFTPEASASSAYSIKNAPNYKANAEPAPIYEKAETEVNYVNKNQFLFDAIHPFRAQLAYNAYAASNSPPIEALSRPVTYTTHTHSTPLEEIQKSGLRYNSYTPIQNEAIKTTLTYADAPAVSHMTFAGHGTTYSW